MSIREVQIQAIADLYELVIVDEYAVQTWPEVIDELRKELDALRQRVAVLEAKGEVDPRNTSRTCPACGCIDKNNRKTQASFVCTSCGFAGPADVIAAGNISRRAAVNPPYGSPDGTASGLVGPKPTD